MTEASRLIIAWRKRNRLYIKYHPFGLDQREVDAILAWRSREAEGVLPPALVHVYLPRALR